MPIVLTPENLVETLRMQPIPGDVLNALVAAFKWAEENQAKSVYAASAAGYLRELDRAGKFGEQSATSYVYSVKLNIFYALGNLNGWRGDEARAVKVILRKFTQGV